MTDFRINDKELCIKLACFGISQGMNFLNIHKILKIHRITNKSRRTVLDWVYEVAPSVSEIQKIIYDNKEHYQTIFDVDLAPYIKVKDALSADFPVEIEPSVEGDKDVHVQELDFYKKEITYFKAENKLLLGKLKRSQLESDLTDKLLNVFVDYITAIPSVKASDIIGVSRSGKRVKETPVLLYSDAHIGEVVDLKQTGGLSSYDFKEFVKRNQYLNNVVLDLLINKLQGYSFDTLEIHMLGDMVSGIIHEELTETGDGTIIEWLLNGAYIVAQMLMSYAKHFKEVNVTCIYGNHGRMKKKPSFKNRYVNFDYIFYHVVSLYCMNQGNINFAIPKSFWFSKKVEDFNVLMLHGDNIKSWNGIPWYGIERALAKLNELLQSLDYSVNIAEFGHFHNAAFLDRVNGEVFINGSFKGGDEYSIGKMFVSNSPRQLLYGVHKDIGVTWDYKVKLDAYSDKMKIKYKYSESISDGGMGAMMRDLMDELDS